MSAGRARAPYLHDRAFRKRSHASRHLAAERGLGYRLRKISKVRILVPRGRSVSLFSDAPRETDVVQLPVFGLLAGRQRGRARQQPRRHRFLPCALATVKKNQGSAKTLAERQNVQTAYADCEARRRSACAASHGRDLIALGDCRTTR